MQVSSVQCKPSITCRIVILARLEGSPLMAPASTAPTSLPPFAITGWANRSSLICWELPLLLSFTIMAHYVRGGPLETSAAPFSEVGGCRNPTTSAAIESRCQLGSEAGQARRGTKGERSSHTNSGNKWVSSHPKGHH